VKSLIRAALILALAFQWPGSVSQVGIASANAAYCSVAANVPPDPVVFITSYSIGKVRVYHFPKISAACDPAGLASVWSDSGVDDPHLVHSHVIFLWEELKPCGDDNYFWELNPVSGRYYQDVDLDGTQQKTPSSAVLLWGLL